MGQFGPTLSRSRGREAHAGFTIFASGFLLSSFVVFFVSSEIGAEFSSFGGTAVVAVILAVGVTMLLAAELASIVRGNQYSIGVWRQTPKAWGHTKLGVFMWGLDTGIPVTTVRTTVLPFGLVLASLLGLTPRMVGVCYATGFLGAVYAAARLGKSSRNELADGSLGTMMQMRRLVLPARTTGALILVAVAGSAVLENAP